MSVSSASPAANSGRAFQTCSHNSRVRATLVIELRDSSTRRPVSASAGTREKSITLRTGPSEVMPRSGSRR